MSFKYYEPYPLPFDLHAHVFLSGNPFGSTHLRPNFNLVHIWVSTRKNMTMMMILITYILYWGYHSPMVAYTRPYPIFQKNTLFPIIPEWGHFYTFLPPLVINRATMSYPVPPPPGHLPAGNVDRSKPLDTPGNEFFGLESQHGPAPPFKRRRNQDDHTQDSASHSQQNPLLNIGTGNIFYKTRLCAKFEGGNCSNGKKCTFAHGFEDLHEPPPNWKENVYANGKGTHRGMKLCRNFIFEKECPFGEKCNFLHLVPCNTEMARALPINISAASTETTGPMLEQRNDTGHTRLNKHLTCPDAFLVDRKFASLKTKMCAKWESTGQCPSKGNCHYAHGQSELVTPHSQNMSSLTKNTSISIKNFRLPLNSGGPPNEAAAPAKVTEVNKSLNWRPPRKIVGIYGDWLDGYSLPDNN